MKFLCDEMLARLGRWLRAAGYDTVVAEDATPDQELEELALKEDRYLITRDRHFLEIKKIENHLIWLEANSVEDCAKELSQKIEIDWTLNPFSRCLVCNHILQEPPQESLEEVPEGVRKSSDKFWYCPKCEKVFWLGSHTDRMLEKLKMWKSL